eukprot:Skav203085  [mRNA]  locus=scaffold447:139723:140109:- [translate_table: standard]
MALVSSTCSPIHHMISGSLRRIPIDVDLLGVLAHRHRTTGVDQTKTRMLWFSRVKELLLHHAVNSIRPNHQIRLLDLAIGKGESYLLVVLGDGLQLVAHENHLWRNCIHHQLLKVSAHDDVSTRPSAG